MKSNILLLFGIILLFMMLLLYSGCAKDPNTANIEDIHFSQHYPTGCCNERYEFDFRVSAVDMTEYYYYWIGIFDQYGKLLGRSTPIKRYGSFSYESIYIDVNYSLKLHDSTYDFYIIASQSHFDVGLTENAKGFSDPVSIRVSESYDMSACQHSCCTNENGKRYTQYEKHETSNGFIGISAKIKTRIGQLCHEGLATDTATSTVHIGAAFRNSINNLVFFQFGFVKLRFPSWGTECSTFVYYDYYDGAYNYTLFLYRHDFIPGPVEGEVNKYIITLEKQAGRWDIYYNNETDRIDFCDNAVWQDKAATIIAFTGEIFNFEDDMPGTESDPCGLSDCSYWPTLGTGFIYANFEDDRNWIKNISPPSGEWGIDKVGASGLRIYDINPL